MILRAILCLLASYTVTRAELPFKLPREARYTASEEAIELAKRDLAACLAAKPAAMTNLFASPMMCGPGLWDLLKASPHFAHPPAATMPTKIGPKDKGVLMPLALLQSEREVENFRKALSELLARQGKLTIREPTKEEFMAFWVATPLNSISGPLLTAEGKDFAIFCHFENGKVLWADEVKRALAKK